MNSKLSLVDSLIKEGWLKTPSIIAAFRKIKRIDFLPNDMKSLAEENEALPIGFGQTISQPLVVAFMIEQLQPKSGQKILDVGAGSGWTSALLAHIVSGGELKSKIKNQKSKINGRVVAIEVIPELMEFGKKNVAKYNFVEKGIAEIICADGSKGYLPEAPYDGILFSASAEKDIPPELKNQLKVGGRIVGPVGNSILALEKISEKEFEKKEFPGFSFVPLIEK